MTIRSINPATEEVIATFDEASPSEIERALAEAAAAFSAWRKMSFAERRQRMHRAGACLRQRKPEFARLITLEMGKPIVEAEAEVEKCAWACEYFAEQAEGFLRAERVQTNAFESYVEYQPLGVILAIMPWNFPFWQVFRFAAPTLMAGNTAILKHASNVPKSALAIGEVFREAGFPSGAFRPLLIPGDKVERLIADDRVRAVTLTGSDIAGSRVAGAAGRWLKKAVLELGGSDPFIVLADADFELAATTAARARYQNAGQSCIAAKRFIVVDSVAQDFEERFATAVASLRVGDPLERATQVGPLARADLLDSLEDQLTASIEQGARVVRGGHRLDRKGYFFEPTIVTNVGPEMRVFREETFGPAAAVIRVPDEVEAIRVANDSRFGLGASLWTRDLDRARQLVREVEAGSVFVNGMVASDPRLPFGGVKRSGYGRELSVVGIREFVNIQTVVMSNGAGASAQRAAE